MIVNLLSQRSGLAAHLAVVAPMAGVAGSMPEFVSGQMRARTTLQDVVSRMPALVHFTRAGMRNSYESRDVPAMLKHIDEARSHFNEFIVAPVNNNGLHQVSWQVALLRDFYMRVGTALRNFVSSSVLGDPVLHDAEWAVFRHVCKDCGRLLNRLERVLRQPISNSTQHLVDFYAALETVEDAVSNSWRDDVTSYISDRFVDVFKQLREQNRRPDLKTVLRQLSKRKPRFSALSEMTPLAARKQIAEAYGAAKTVALSWTTLMAHLETTLHMTPSRGRLVSTKTAKSRAGQTVQDTTTRKLQSAAEALPPSRRTQLKREKSSELTRQNARSTSLPSQPEPLPQVSQDELRVEDAAVPAVDEFFEPPVKSKTRQTSRMSQAASARVPVQPDVPPPALPPSQRTKRHPERASQDAEPDVRSRSTSLPNQPEPPCKPEPASQSEPVNELGSLSALVVEDPGEQFLEPSARRSETTPVVSKPPPAQLQPPTEQDDPASQASDAANSPAVRPNEVRLASPRPAQSEFSAQTGRIPSKGASVAHLAVVQRGQSKSDESESDQISSKPTKSDMSDQVTSKPRKC
ncbi:MAG: hypothetical protein KVP17_000556 [Porospora cf. gigantea B]|uniref:uncharacterized protein n=1 Tax=Porospora cf. gigantea B TaxID=2853592 RepID=UPI003571CD14|nr:MAG: hypothetical protein KVP17_000556 [Porospora cf. gigantea B]